MGYGIRHWARRKWKWKEVASKDPGSKPNTFPMKFVLSVSRVGQGAGPYSLYRVEMIRVIRPEHCDDCTLHLLVDTHAHTPSRGHSLSQQASLKQRLRFSKLEFRSHSRLPLLSLARCGSETGVLDIGLGTLSMI